MELQSAKTNSAKAMMREMEGKVKELEEARKELDKGAAQVLQRIDALFCELVQHKHELVEWMRVVRKDACQPIADVGNACRVLRRVVRSAEESNGIGEGNTHVGFALVVGGGEVTTKVRSGGIGGRGKRKRVLLVEFVVPNGDADGTVRVALDSWKACRLCTEVDGGAWEARRRTSRPLPSLNTARYHHGAAVVTPSNHVYVVGGGGKDGCLNSVEGLEDGSDAWRTAPGLAIATARERCGACAVGTTLIVVGGFDDRNHSDVVEAVDTVSGTRTALPPFPRKVSACGVVSLQGMVIVTGGCGRGPSSNFSTVWVLDLGNSANLPRQRWESLPSMAQARRFHGAAAGGGRAFVCGGVDDHGDLDSCEMLRVTVGGGGKAGQRAWEALPPMPNKLSQVGCCYGGGNVFVAGGAPFAQQSVYALHVRQRRWTQVAKLKKGCHGCAAVCVERRVMVLGGYNHLSNSGQLGGCEVFEF